MSKTKKTPEFQSEAEERAFWESHDSSDYVDWNEARPTLLPRLKPSTKIDIAQASGDLAGSH